MTQVWVYTMLNTHILKDYEERRYPSVNQACIEEKFKMPEQEDNKVVEDGDDGEWTYKKAMDFLEIFMKNMYKSENEADKKIYHHILSSMKLYNYISGDNKKGQEMEGTSPVISTIKRKKVGYIY